MSCGFIVSGGSGALRSCRGQIEKQVLQNLLEIAYGGLKSGRKDNTKQTNELLLRAL